MVTRARKGLQGGLSAIGIIRPGPKIPVAVCLVESGDPFGFGDRGGQGPGKGRTGGQFSARRFARKAQNQRQTSRDGQPGHFYKTRKKMFQIKPFTPETPGPYIWDLSFSEIDPTVNHRSVATALGPISERVTFRHPAEDCFHATNNQIHLSFSGHSRRPSRCVQQKFAYRPDPTFDPAILCFGPGPKYAITNSHLG